MSAYRKITFPKCPHCGFVQNSTNPSNYNYGRLVNMAMGIGSSNVILQCEKCKEKYRIHVIFGSTQAVLRNSKKQIQTKA